MCTFVVLRRPGSDWPVIAAANRDEMHGRPWAAPARHWKDRPHVVAGRDGLAGGTWFGMNDDGVVAGVLNRPGSLGPAKDKRSRGELPLEALDHAEAAAAAEALTHLDGTAYRGFNLVIADANDGFCLISRGAGPVHRHALEEGVSMITARGVNATEDSLRARRYLPLFENAEAPDPGLENWDAWAGLVSRTDHEAEGGDRDAMAIRTDSGFQTVCTSFLALPKPRFPAKPPKWLFSPGFPGEAPFGAVSLASRPAPADLGAAE